MLSNELFTLCGHIDDAEGCYQVGAWVGWYCIDPCGIADDNPVLVLWDDAG